MRTHKYLLYIAYDPQSKGFHWQQMYRSTYVRAKCQSMSPSHRLYCIAYCRQQNFSIPIR